MKTTKKMYVLTVGEYSDYRVLGVFSSPELAEEVYAKRKDIGRDYCHSVEEYFLNNDPNAPEGMKPCSVIMRRDGSVTNIQINPDGSSTYEDQFISEKIDRRFYMWARDDKHAVKIANERRTKMIAENQW